MNLKEKLYEIEVAIIEEDFNKAFILYEEINKNWLNYEKSLRDSQNLCEILNLVNYIKKILEDKLETLKVQNNFLKVRKKYLQY